MDAPKPDTHCTRCRQPLTDPYWVIHGDARHLECVDWTTLPRPPYTFRAAEIRARRLRVLAELEALERAGRALADARKSWPKDGLSHATKILAAMQHLDLYWPSDEPGGERR